ncbi:hypothetical protein F5884DRAFT_791633 [Xylogone sp. PMI_703]|nr:hypothetical protein F5884DRAFT_791633 [Xylogone sp. PMI_703]
MPSQFAAWAAVARRVGALVLSQADPTKRDAARAPVQGREKAKAPRAGGRPQEQHRVGNDVLNDAELVQYCRSKEIQIETGR